MGKRAGHAHCHTTPTATPRPPPCHAHTTHPLCTQTSLDVHSFPPQPPDEVHVHSGMTGERLGSIPAPCGQGPVTPGGDAGKPAAWGSGHEAPCAG